MSVKSPKSVVIAIDTNEYAGNFERQMCAFITGQVGDCGVGDRIAEEAIDELSDGANSEALFWIEEHIVHEPDDHSCHRPASIWPTPGRANNGSGVHFNEGDIDAKDCWKGCYWPAYESVAIFFDEVPPKEVMDVIIERAKRFANDRPDWQPYLGITKKKLKISSVRVLKPLLDHPRMVEHTEVASYKGSE